MSWFENPVVLRSKYLTLEPLQKLHFEELIALAAEEKIWEFLPANCSDKSIFERDYLDALNKRENLQHYPFVIRLSHNQKLIGSTRYFDINENHRNFEIAWTWYHPKYWASGFNLDVKLTMLTYCFDVLKCIRVQFKTSDTNIRSRRAIEKIGATFEGIHRKDRIRENNSIRNSVYYSIIDDEWNEIKLKLPEKTNEIKLQNEI